MSAVYIRIGDITDGAGSSCAASAHQCRSQDYFCQQADFCAVLHLPLPQSARQRSVTVQKGPSLPCYTQNCSTGKDATYLQASKCSSSILDVFCARAYSECIVPSARVSSQGSRAAGETILEAKWYRIASSRQRRQEGNPSSARTDSEIYHVDADAWNHFILRYSYS